MEKETVKLGATYRCQRLDGIYYDAEVIKSRRNKREREDQFFVRFLGLHKTKYEWVEKSRIALSTRVMGENTEDQDMAENGLTPENGDSEQEMKVKATEDLVNSLESWAYLEEMSEDLAKELTCPLCMDLFKDPVIISCSHNFCNNCIEEAWSGQESFVCPDCETVITEKMYIPNLTLDSLVRKWISISTVNYLVTPMPREMTMIHSNCPDHDERLKLFCKEDGALSCLICRDSLKHSGHNFLPIMDAVKVYRTQLSAATSPLQEALQATRQLNSEQTEKIQQVKTNMEECKQHVVTEFKKLEDFVQQQVELLLWHLRVQGKDVVTQMENNLTRVQENEKNIEQAISLANEMMNVTEASSFLSGTKSLIEKFREQQTQFSSNILVDKKLNDSTYKGPIVYSVWKEMRSLVSPEFGDQDNLAAQAPEKPETDTESGDQDNLAAQASEKPAKGPQNNRQQTKPVPPVTALKRGPQNNQQHSKPVPPGKDPKTGPQNNRQQSKPVPPGTAPKTGSRKILILGNAVISLAEQQAKTGSCGHDLGFGQENYSVHWEANRDIGWDSLLPELRIKVAVIGVPNILVIHVGENDLASMPNNDILKVTIKRVFRDIRVQYKDTTVFWSCMLPRAEWRFTPLEKRRRNYNKVVSGYILLNESKFKVINHVKFDKMYKERCGNQPTHGEVREFSSLELDIFCMDIRDAIRGAV